MKVFNERVEYLFLKNLVLFIFLILLALIFNVGLVDAVYEVNASSMFIS
jgi:signal peptidase I